MEPLEDGLNDPVRPRIFVDADACPVKDEIYRVADRYRVPVFVVANTYLRVASDPLVRLKVVETGPDAADDWIAAQTGAGDIVITADIPLASRCLKTGALVIGATGKPFTEASIGMALAGRGLAEHLRSIGETTRGPNAFGPKDRSRFLSALDEAVNRIRRAPSPMR